MTEFGPLDNACICMMVLDASVQYEWKVLFKTILLGVCSMKEIAEYLETLMPHSGYKLCLGLRKYPEEVRFETKNICVYGACHSTA